MTDVTRYELTIGIQQRETVKHDGEWVKYADHAEALRTLTAENARLREDAAMDRSMTDEHRCEQCRDVVPIREIVTLYDGAALLCVPCAELYRVRRVA